MNYVDYYDVTRRLKNWWHKLRAVKVQECINIGSVLYTEYNSVKNGRQQVLILIVTRKIFADKVKKTKCHL